MPVDPLVRKLLFLLFPAFLAAQTLQFGADFGGRCVAVVCVMNVYWYPDTVTSIAVDPSGNTYVAGTSHGLFPLVNAIEPSPYSIIQIGTVSTPFVAKIDPTGTKLLYATPVGAPQEDGPSLLPTALAIDAAGNAYITGTAPPNGFPSLAGTTPLGSLLPPTSNDAFFIKLDPNGKLLLSTRFGGSADDAGNSIALDPSGAINIVGTTQSSDFPVTTGPSLTATQDIFFAKLDPASGSVTYATLLGQGAGPQLAIGLSGDLLIAASTTSSAWHTTSGAPQAACAGSPCADVIALRFRPSTSQIVYATYLGGTSVDTLEGIASDSAGSLYLTGTTASYDFPTSATAFQPVYSCNIIVATTCGTKAFAAHLNPTGTALLYSTYIGGTMTEQGHAIAIDGAGNAYLAGQTISSDFPLLHAIQPTIIPTMCSSNNYESVYYCGGAGFVTVLNPKGSALISSTYLGEYGAPNTNAGAFNGAYAVAVDATGNVYVAGDDLALAPAQLNPSSAANASGNASVVKIAQTGTPVTLSAMTTSAGFARGLPYGGGLASLFFGGLTGAESILIGSGDPLETQLGGITIKVGGEPAPLLAFANFGNGGGQVNFQVPFDRGQGTPVPNPVVEVDYNGTATFMGFLPVAPGIFTLGDGSGAIEHGADYSLVTKSNPVVPGEAIIIYATGLGQVVPAQQTGVPFVGAAQPDVVGPAFVVIIGDTSCNVLYAGTTPTFVGLYQINCVTSSALSSGSQTLRMIFYFNPTFGSTPPPYAVNSNTVILPVQ